MKLIPYPRNPQAPKMKNPKLGFARYRTPMLAVMVTLGTLMLAQPSHAAACVNGVLPSRMRRPQWGCGSSQGISAPLRLRIPPPSG